MPKWHHCPTRRVLLARLRGGFSSFAAHNSANCTRRGIQSGPPGTYYNSQLGAWIRKSGAAGIRIHDVSLARIRAQEWASHGALLLPRLLRLHPASIDLGSFSQGAQLRPQCAAPVFAKGPVLEQAEQLRAALQGNAPHAAEGDGSWPASTLFSVLASTASELDEWAGVDAIGPEQKMVTIPVSILQEQSRALDTVLALVHTTKEAGMQVKIRLTDAFADSYLLQDIVLAVADHGADVVIVEGNGDEEADDVRDDLEALLGLDVSGVPPCQLPRCFYRACLFPVDSCH
jgi:hypothetical protein